MRNQRSRKRHINSNGHEVCTSPHDGDTPLVIYTLASMPADLKQASDSLAKTGRTLRRAQDAWATWRGAAQNAHIAAVMGYSLPRHLRPGPEASWSVAESLRSDAALQRQIRDSCWDHDHADALQATIEGHIRWVLAEVERGIVSDIESHDASFDLDDPNPTLQAEANAAEAAHKAVRKLEERLETARNELASLEEATLGKGFNKARSKAIKLHSEQLDYVTGKASELAFCDDALTDVADTIAQEKSGWADNSREFFTSADYASLTKERKSITTERAHVELELQSYFDHHAHGASHSETVKPDRQALKLAPELEKQNAGFKQVQLIDMYCLSRGNEMWAIIPDLLRVGHDVDPIDCVHWQPPAESDVDPALAPYRREQNRAFAQRLLSLVQPGLRSKLLAQHKHGVSKREFKADQHDGCALYWVMLQLYHPLSRDYRRSLELRINRYSSRFASGDPSIPLGELQAHLQEALDLMLRVRWDTAAVPIIDTLGARDALFQVELAQYRDLPADPDDSAVELDQMCSHIATVIETLNTARKNWDEKAALSASSSQEKQRLQKVEQQLQALMSSERGKPFNPRQQSQHAPKPGHCHAQGCGCKIQGWTSINNWKLCSTCLLKVKSTGKPITLYDGKQWGRPGKTNLAVNRNTACSVLGSMRAEGVKGIAPSKSERRALAAKRAREQPVSDPESPLGGQDGDADQDDELVPFGEGTERMFRSLKAKAEKSAKGASKKRRVQFRK